MYPSLAGKQIERGRAVPYGPVAGQGERGVATQRRGYHVSRCQEGFSRLVTTLNQDSAFLRGKGLGLRLSQLGYSSLDGAMSGIILLPEGTGMRISTTYLGASLNLGL